MEKESNDIRFMAPGKRLIRRYRLTVQHTADDEAFCVLPTEVVQKLGEKVIITLGPTTDIGKHTLSVFPEDEWYAKLEDLQSSTEQHPSINSMLRYLVANSALREIRNNTLLIPDLLLMFASIGNALDLLWDECGFFLAAASSEEEIEE